MQQVSKQVQKAMEAANFVKPLPHFDYVPTVGCKPSHRYTLAPSHRYSSEMLEASQLDQNGQPQKESHDRSMAPNACSSSHASRERLAKSTIASIPYATHSQQTAYNKCHELRKALHELVNKGQIDRFLKRGPCFLQREYEPARPEPRDEECFTEVMATIAGGYAEGITRSAWKAQLRGIQQVLTAEQGLRGQEVNPTGMIRLPLHFADKVKAKNLEVDFLVVDVPTTYNIILGRPTFYKGYTSSSPSSSLPLSTAAPWPSSSRVLALPSRGTFSSSSRSPLSIKGGLNCTCSGPRSNLLHGKLKLGSLRPCGRTQHSPRDPGDSLIARPWPLSQSSQLPQPRPWKVPRPTCDASLSPRSPVLLSLTSASPSDVYT
ncbi:hypothetical protein Cgig2_003777 [Carnegiea gigantea]|uniref:Uncharacterized protein n=1 Tax=Carnegiea gigantea TaxID=171969 RepID=A0A9Q1JG73_9CARY|nr:hypothetical protein Cgig2_003777 [Carnegiea gigantea]